MVVVTRHFGGAEGRKVRAAPGKSPTLMASAAAELVEAAGLSLYRLKILTESQK